MIASLFALSLSVTGCSAPQTVLDEAKVVGRAMLPASGQVQYCEYFLPGADSWRVLYFAPDGQKIAEKRVACPGGQGTLPVSARPDVAQEDFRFGEVREAVKQQDEWLLRYRPQQGASMQETRVPARKVDVVDAGFDAFVRANYAALASGQALNFGFASPLHGRVITLRARQAACIAPEPDLCIDVELSSGFLRWLAGGKIYLEYAAPASGDSTTEPARLMRFTGTVNLLSDAGKSQTLDIRYFYP
uniref:hypothetical protein n=1 Tax=Microbulbifer agarilyticus TaxID=260552 RepID=UPI000255BB8D|nr:hypothetical protein [Microbulbifer agarilyticus]